MGPDKVIGGFHEFAIDEIAVSKHSVLRRWGQGAKTFHSFRNASSALHALIKTRKSVRLFVPDYICSSIPEAAAEANAEVLFYRQSENLEPDLNALDQVLKPKDLVLVVCYFGRPTTQELVEFAGRHREVEWIEDRAQALWPGDNIWSDWILYSPRKLFGVPDGGFLFSSRHSLVLPDRSEVSDMVSQNPQSLICRVGRLESRGAPEELDWHPSFSTSENLQRTSMSPCSRLTLGMLDRISIEQAVERRSKNASTLIDALGDEFDVFDVSPAPFMVVVKAENADAIRHGLADRKVFTPMYWPASPSFPRQSRVANTFGSSHVFLPCDQRYSIEDMVHLGEVYRQVCKALG